MRNVAKNINSFPGERAALFCLLVRVVSIEAAHFTSRVDRAGAAWQVIPGLGRTADSVAVFPEDAPSVEPQGKGRRDGAYREGIMAGRLAVYFLLTSFAVAGLGSFNSARAAEPFALWPQGAPGALGKEASDVPTLTPYLAPKERATGAAIVVCPGGGYQHLAEHEGRPVAEWLNSIGVTAFVLKYRLGPRYRHPSMSQDASRAVRTVRARAAEWGLDPERVGILGFSAGGHLASTAGTHFDAGRADAADPIERVSSRPSVQILIYPVITMREKTHAGSRRNLLGENPVPELVALLSNEEQVTKETPPAFLVHTMTDTAVPVENTLMFVSALRKAGVPFELHLYERGPHGFGLGTARQNRPADPILSTWPAHAADWLRIHGFVKQ